MKKEHVNQPENQVANQPGTEEKQQEQQEEVVEVEVEVEGEMNEIMAMKNKIMQKQKQKQKEKQKEKQTQEQEQKHEQEQNQQQGEASLAEDKSISSTGKLQATNLTHHRIYREGDKADKREGLTSKSTGTGTSTSTGTSKSTGGMNEIMAMKEKIMRRKENQQSAQLNTKTTTNTTTNASTNSSTENTQSESSNHRHAVLAENSLVPEQKSTRTAQAGITQTTSSIVPSTSSPSIPKRPCAQSIPKKVTSPQLPPSVPSSRPSAIKSKFRSNATPVNGNCNSNSNSDNSSSGNSKGNSLSTTAEPPQQTKRYLCAKSSSSSSESSSSSPCNSSSASQNTSLSAACRADSRNSRIASTISTISITESIASISTDGAVEEDLEDEEEEEEEVDEEQTTLQQQSQHVEQLPQSQGKGQEKGKRNGKEEHAQESTSVSGIVDNDKPIPTPPALQLEVDNLTPRNSQLPAIEDPNTSTPSSASSHNGLDLRSFPPEKVLLGVPYSPSPRATYSTQTPTHTPRQQEQPRWQYRLRQQQQQQHSPQAERQEGQVQQKSGDSQAQQHVQQHTQQQAWESQVAEKPHTTNKIFDTPNLPPRPNASSRKSTLVKRRSSSSPPVPIDDTWGLKSLMNSGISRTQVEAEAYENENGNENGNNDVDPEEDDETSSSSSNSSSSSSSSNGSNISEVENDMVGDAYGYINQDSFDSVDHPSHSGNDNSDVDNEEEDDRDTAHEVERIGESGENQPDPAAPHNEGNNANERLSMRSKTILVDRLGYSPGSVIKVQGPLAEGQAESGPYRPNPPMQRQSPHELEEKQKQQRMQQQRQKQQREQQLGQELQQRLSGDNGVNNRKTSSKPAIGKGKRKGKQNEKEKGKEREKGKGKTKLQQHLHQRQEQVQEQEQMQEQEQSCSPSLWQRMRSNGRSLSPMLLPKKGSPTSLSSTFSPQGDKQAGEPRAKHVIASRKNQNKKEPRERNQQQLSSELQEALLRRRSGSLDVEGNASITSTDCAIGTSGADSDHIHVHVHGNSNTSNANNANNASSKGKKLDMQKRTETSPATTAMTNCSMVPGRKNATGTKNTNASPSTMPLKAAGQVGQSIRGMMNRLLRSRLEPNGRGRRSQRRLGSSRDNAKRYSQAMVGSALGNIQRNHHQYNGHNSVSQRHNNEAEGDGERMSNDVEQANQNTGANNRNSSSSSSLRSPRQSARYSRREASAVSSMTSISGEKIAPHTSRRMMPVTLDKNHILPPTKARGSGFERMKSRACSAMNLNISRRFIRQSKTTQHQYQHQQQQHSRFPEHEENAALKDCAWQDSVQQVAEEVLGNTHRHESSITSGRLRDSVRQSASKDRLASWKRRYNLEFPHTDVGGSANDEPGLRYDDDDNDSDSSSSSSDNSDLYSDTSDNDDDDDDDNADADDYDDSYDVTKIIRFIQDARQESTDENKWV